MITQFCLSCNEETYTEFCDDCRKIYSDLGYEIENLGNVFPEDKDIIKEERQKLH